MMRVLGLCAVGLVLVGWALTTCAFDAVTAIPWLALLPVAAVVQVKAMTRHYRGQ